MKLNEKLIQKGINAIASNGRKVEEQMVAPVQENSDKLVREMDFQALIGQSITKIKEKVSPLTKKEFDKALNQKISHLYGSEEEGIKELAKIDEDNYNSHYIDLAQEIKRIAQGTFGEEFGETEMVIRFLKGENGIDENLKTKVLQLIKKDPQMAVAVSGLESYYKISPEIKESLLDLTGEMHMGGIKDIDSVGRSLSYDNATELILNYVRDDLPESIQKKRIGKLHDIVKHIGEVTPATKLYDADQYKNVSDLGDDFEELYKLADEFLDSSILPTESLVNEYVQNPQRFWNFMAPWSKKGEVKIGMDEYSLVNILKNENSKLREMFLKKIEVLDPSKKNILFLKENTLNLQETQFKLLDASSENNKITTEIFQKDSGNLVSTEEISFKPNDITVNCKEFEKGIESTQHLRLPNEIKPGRQLNNETITYKDKAGKVLFTDITKESSIEGQFDIYRKHPDGKIEVLAKAFKDPQTGETIIKQKFVSHGGVKTSYNYKSSKNGDYSLDYVITGNDGKILMDNHKKYRMIDENNSETISNGKTYKVNFDGDFINIAIEGEDVRQLNLKELIPSGNPELIDLIKYLPGNELASLNKSKIKRVLDKYVPNNACLDHASRYEIDVDKNAPYVINMGKNLRTSRFVFLHELGHCKDEKISKENYEKIIKIYKEEIALNNAKNSISQDKVMDYLIDSEHYLNYRGGAIREVVPDVNGHLNIPVDSDLIGIRTIKFKKDFPKTIACIAKNIGE